MINPVYFSYISSPLYEPAGEEPVASGTEEMINPVCFLSYISSLWCGCTPPHKPRRAVDGTK